MMARAVKARTYPSADSIQLQHMSYSSRHPLLHLSEVMFP